MTGYIHVLVNGIQATVGNGTKDKDCYFSSDGGTTAKLIADIVPGDGFYWNANVAGFELDGNDRVDFNYNAPL